MSADASASPTRVTAPRSEADGRREHPGLAPVFIAGADRSGTTLLFALLASHPNLSMARRTNMWRYFHRRYGDLADPQNIDRCLADMLRYRRMRHLEPDAERIRREFLAGEPTYGRLFALFHQHHAEALGKSRWGDKSLHTERYADRVFQEFPDARIIQMVRDPRDRYASVRKRHGRDVPRVGAATERWLGSTRSARRNLRRFPGRYTVVRYEDLARDPEGILRDVCAFIGEEYTPSMLRMTGATDLGQGNSSFGDVDPHTISTKAIGRYRTVLSPMEREFIQLVAGRASARMGYARDDAGLSGAELIRFSVTFLPVQLAKMVVAWGSSRFKLWLGERRPPFRFADQPSTEANDGA